MSAAGTSDAACCNTAVSEHVLVDSMYDRAASSAYSPPPCGEGLGVGVVMNRNVIALSHDPPP
jgi:hypothetical protein